MQEYHPANNKSSVSDILDTYPVSFNILNYLTSYIYLWSGSCREKSINPAR